MLSVLTACGGGDPATPLDDDGDGLYTEIACPGLDLESTSGVTLDEIPVGSLPGSFEPPISAALDVSDGEHSGFAHLRTGDGGTLLLSVPLHPEAPLDGGAVTLTFTDGTKSCAPVDFTILPLPAADGELEATVDLLQASLADQAAVLETTPEELRSTPVEDMAPSLWPLAMTQALIDHPANDVSLRAIAEGALGSEPLDWIDRLLARTELRASLEAPTETPAPASTPSRSVEGLLCEPEFVQTGEILDFCMSKAAEIARSAAGASAEVAAGIQQVFGDLSENGLPVAGEVQAVFAAMFWVIYSQREAEAALLPSYFVSAEASADPVELFEDDESQGQLSLDVTAANLGYDMKKQLIDGIKQAMSLADEIGGFDFSTGTALDKAVSKLVPQFEAAMRDLNIDELKFDSELFPVPLVEVDWVDARVVSGDAVTIVDGVTWSGNAAGTATVSVRTKDGQFGGQQIAAQLSLQVPEIQIHISPTETLVKAGEVKTFDVTVSKSAHPDMVALVQPTPLQGDAELTPGSEGHHYVTYVAPVEPDYDTPDLLTVEHTARTGARESGEPPRRGTATIRFGGITLAPVLDCVSPGETKQLHATVEGIEGDPELVWTYSAGDVSDGGLFTAPNEAGPVEITVALAEDPDVQDSITIDVGMCVCSFSVTIGTNPTYTSQPGDSAWYNAYNLTSPAATGAIGTIEFDSPDAAFVLVVELPTTIVTGPGSYPLDDAAGGLGYGGPDDFVFASPDDSGTLTIFEYEQHTKLTGEFYGTTHDWENDRDGPGIPYQGAFQIYPDVVGSGPAGATGRCGVTEAGMQ
jgi:hypothetical protein